MENVLAVDAHDDAQKGNLEPPRETRKIRRSQGPNMATILSSEVLSTSARHGLSLSVFAGPFHSQPWLHSAGFLLAAIAMNLQVGIPQFGGKAMIDMMVAQFEDAPLSLNGMLAACIMAASGALSAVYLAQFGLATVLGAVVVTLTAVRAHYVINRK